MKNPFFLQENYLEKGLSIAQIAAMTFSSKGTVRAALKEHKIPTREQHLPHGRNSQPRFGKKYWQGKLISDKIELKVIRAILDYKKQGMGLRQTARMLNNLNIATKCKSSKWHPEMVRRIIKHVEADQPISPEVQPL